jgi:signal recognition particle receptor subunit beta
MVLVNYANRELTAKIVYYGPGLCGKTTNLEFIHRTLPSKTRGKMLSLATQTDRTLFFDFLPIELGSIRGMKTKIQLYTVPGQVFYDATRKLVLKGADGVVFVADSQKEMMESNLDSWQNFKTNLKENNIDVHSIPLVIQYNKRDLPNVLPVSELNRRINEFNSPYFEAVALSGQGVQDTLKGITKLVMEFLTKRYKTKKPFEELAATATPAASAAVSPAAPPKAASGISKNLPTVEQVVKEAMKEVPVPVIESHKKPLAVEPVALDVSAEEYEELEEISELTTEPEPAVAAQVSLSAKPAIKKDVPVVQPEASLEMLDSSNEIFADDSGPQEKVIHFEAPVGRTQDVSVPIEVRVGPPGEEVRLQIAFELKIKILPK